MTLRMGLAGTGYWADVTHAAAVGDAPSWELTAVWGRDASRAAELAARHDARHAGDDFDAFLAQVDAVTFAIPPHVQSELALRAVQAGKHVALEKPVALDPAAAHRLVEAAEAHDVATVVMFTMMYDPRMRAIVDETRAGRHWTGGAGLWLGSALSDDNPFNTPWRHEELPIWDVGPHAVAALWCTVGPIVDVLSAVYEDDMMHVVFAHEGGRTSSCSMTLRAPDAADGFSTLVWGDSGRLELPVDDVDSRASFATAYEELAELIRTGERHHDYDVRFGTRIVEVSALAQDRIRR
ncbi:Gfo/Idh/MocA family protein [Homoserinibacter gongjuensis]|uniref:Oxidoreductase n=1 Tax=Homoserinibacter gongjuensis TaxID=1162968 RepID=A0ABQ6JVS5_9MICO|nr:Gfo/Idh/MocA family oxidoreductase [Homoserinibacter gongjuensis]GMA92318.1 oxidoreductase [Homoserinibacter gongjuensis]